MIPLQLTAGMVTSYLQPHMACLRPQVHTATAPSASPAPFRAAWDLYPLTPLVPRLAGTHPITTCHCSPTALQGWRPFTQHLQTSSGVQRLSFSNRTDPSQVCSSQSTVPRSWARHRVSLGHMVIPSPWLIVLTLNFHNFHSTTWHAVSIS